MTSSATTRESALIISLCWPRLLVASVFAYLIVSWLVHLSSPRKAKYTGAMNAAINCALANRQILAHLIRDIFAQIYPHAMLETLFDFSHNTCKLEKHEINGKPRLLHVHRKGATRAFGSGHSLLPKWLS